MNQISLSIIVACTHYLQSVGKIFNLISKYLFCVQTTTHVYILLVLVVELPQHKVHLVFKNDALNQTFERIELLLHAHKHPNDGLTFRICDTDTSHDCDGPAQQSVVTNPFRDFYTLDLGLQKTPELALELELIGTTATNKFSVVSLVVIKRRQKIPKIMHQRPKRSPRKRHPRSCHVQPWSVKASELHWDIVSPLAFQANFCTGGCPITFEMFSNNAVVRFNYNRFTAKNGRKIPGASCVPIRLSPLDVLYLNKQQTVSYKVYDAVLVDECGCL